MAVDPMVDTNSSIIPWLEERVDAAGDRLVILRNPDLNDKVSAAGHLTGETKLV
jgi:hypothetical protein